MKYTKTAKTYEQQADLLISRGMLGDRASIIEHLSAVNYYRLSGYWHPFMDQPTGKFVSGTTFDMIWDRYVFDRQLRLLTLDAIERIEVYLRTRLANVMAMEDADPFAYLGNPSIMPGYGRAQHSDFVAEIIRTYGRSKAEFVTHFSDKYGDTHSALPIWMAVETMTFGMMRQLYGAVSPTVKATIAASLGVHDTVLSSWVEVLNLIRNMSAHHGRLWNRTMGVRPKIPQKDAAWHQPVEIHNDRMFGILTICRYCLKRIAPQSKWQTRLEDLFNASPSIPIHMLGFPADWKSSPMEVLNSNPGRIWNCRYTVERALYVLIHTSDSSIACKGLLFTSIFCEVAHSPFGRKGLSQGYCSTAAFITFNPEYPEATRALCV